jgi:hypothetical protein
MERPIFRDAAHSRPVASYRDYARSALVQSVPRARRSDPESRREPPNGWYGLP